MEVAKARYNGRMTHIAFLEVDDEDASAVKAKFPSAFVSAKPLSGVDVNGTMSDAEVLCCFIYSRIGRKELDAMPKLKLICTRSVGYDHIDAAACVQRGITVCNVPDYGSHVIAEHVFALLLAATRHITEADARVQSGNFDYHGLRGMSLRGKTIGVLGTGKIGRKVCAIAHGFGMRILACDKCRTLELERDLGVRYVSYDDILRESDVLTLHLPATKQTEHIVNDAAIALMKNDAILINTARGSLIDTAALVRALESGKFSHVLLDVMEHEKNFEKNSGLVAHPKVVATPHIAFFADQSVRAMYDDAFMSIDQHLRNERPEHAVKTETEVCDLDGLKKQAV